ncbi:dienelactone hydrolase family protein [Asticcacaulis solisilvae]|uniref:dienelactone hydrolase family protein n=1 Tax=Asticcacaulis solisilvae TaxID=1217274 RepID=UPI003FD85CB6
MTGQNGTAFSYSAGGQAYLGLRIAGPARPRAGVVLLPDWRGVSSLARDHAAFLTGLGCEVVIADLYGGGFNPASPDEVGPMVRRLMENRTAGVAALAGCIEAFRPTLAAGTPILCLGFSAGAMVAIDYGRSGADLAGIIVCSALLKTAGEGMDIRIKAPVLVLQGTQDQVSPVDVIAAVIAEMDEAGNDARFVLFSQTHHAFDNPEAGDDPAARLCYSALSAGRARAAIRQFLEDVVEA